MIPCVWELVDEEVGGHLELGEHLRGFEGV